MESLPLLPGYIFSSYNSTLKDYKLKQKLKFLYGFRVIGDIYNADSASFKAKFTDCQNQSAVKSLIKEVNKIKSVINHSDGKGNNNSRYDPTFTYGHPKCSNNYVRQPFVPHYVLFAQKCLRFEAYFKQGIFGSPNEYYRIRHVNIFYYLEDDTMAVIEPPVKNVGFKQGKLVKRSKIPKSDKQVIFYHWKDLNIGIEIAIYGVVYHIVNCDQFSREFLNSQGIDVAESESMPPDPYLQNRALKESIIYLTGSSTERKKMLAENQHYRFLEYDRMVLSFEAMWNEKFFKIRYYLVDNTVAVSTLRRSNDGKEKNGSMLLKRTKVPKNWKDLPSTYPGIYAEKNEVDVNQYYSPSDLKVGETIFIFGRRFLLYDCDCFTRKYYSDILKIEQPHRMTILDEISKIYPQMATTSTEYKKTKNQSSQDVIRQLYHFPKMLRYSLAIDVVYPEDEGRKFILEYNLSDNSIRINEVARRNSGRITGCFLNWIRVPKPDGTEYYTPNDFYIGNKLSIFGHWFIITGTDLFVYKYMLANPEKFHENLRKNIREYMKIQGLIDENNDSDETTPSINNAENIELKHHLDDTCCDTINKKTKN